MKPRTLVIAAVTSAFPLLAACSGHSPHATASHSATPSSAAAAASRAAAACSKLSAAAFPPAAYDDLVIHEASRVAHGGSLTPAQTRKVKATVAAEVKAACPQFAYLAKIES